MEYDFGVALDYLKRGERIARVGWNGVGMYLTLQNTDSFSKMTLPYIYITTVTGDLIPWVASQTDLLSSDWYIVNDSL